jgi:tRNA(Ile)-lysidine synthase
LSRFLGKIRRTVARHGLLQGGEGVLVCVSGGPDSMALLQSLWELSREWNLSLTAAYLDHGLRPEAEAEKAFVREAAFSRGLSFVSERADVRGLARKNRLPLQEAARNARYDFFLRAAAGFTAEKIALGHTADDQAESVLMRLLRGSGTRGLAGIPPKRNGRIIRPLLEVRREEVEGYLRERNVPFCDDVSNRSLHYLRNRVRRELMPFLETYNPRIRRILSATGEQFRLEEDFWQDLVRERFPALLRGRGEAGLRLDMGKLCEAPLPLRLRFFRRAVETLLGHLRGFSFRHIQAVENLRRNPGPNKKISLPGGLVVARRYDELFFSRGGEEGAAFAYPVDGPGVLRIPEIGGEIRLALRERGEKEVFPDDPAAALLDGDRIRFPLLVRSFRPGDRFQPLGMPGRKKIKDFFIDLKIPADRRRKVPLLIFEEEIVWVAGLRPDHRFRLKPETRRVLEAELLRT